MTLSCHFESGKLVSGRLVGIFTRDDKNCVVDIHTKEVSENQAGVIVKIGFQPAPTRPDVVRVKRVHHHGKTS